MSQYTPNASAQHWDPERYRRNASFVPALGQGVLQWLDAQPGERILDLGCGDGALTVQLAAICDTVGVDQSVEQVAAAKAKELDARVVDGAELSFAGEFDAVFSNAALHWMRDADAVVDGVWRALKPGGRFVAEMGGAGNVATVIAALEAAVARRGVDPRAANPWYFPTAEEYREKLERRGFAVERVLLFPRPTPLPGRLADWLDTFGESFFALVPEAARAEIMAEVEAAVRDRLYDARKGWHADYIRLRFAAVKVR